MALTFATLQREELFCYKLQGGINELGVLQKHLSLYTPSSEHFIFTQHHWIYNYIYKTLTAQAPPLSNLRHFHLAPVQAFALF